MELIAWLRDDVVLVEIEMKGIVPTGASILSLNTEILSIHIWIARDKLIRTNLSEKTLREVD